MYIQGESVMAKGRSPLNPGGDDCCSDAAVIAATDDDDKTMMSSLYKFYWFLAHSELSECLFTFTTT